MFRGFPIGGGGKRAEFRAEFFNLLDHSNWGSPCGTSGPGCTADVNSSTFGRTFGVGSSSAPTRARASVRSGWGFGSSSDMERPLVNP